MVETLEASRFAGAPALGGGPRRDHQHLPVLMLCQYLFFLLRRPISKSNVHYLEARLSGLKALAASLDASSSVYPVRLVEELRAVHAGGLARATATLQFLLLPALRTLRILPPDIVVEDASPPSTWLARHRSALLILGPGIGIGDELILSRLPTWLKEENPELRVDVLTGYDALWSRVANVDGVSVYMDHTEVCAALRGQREVDGQPYDLIIFADFETPELYRGVAFDGRTPAYLELSLGSRNAALLDNVTRSLFRIHNVTPYGENYYFALDNLARRLQLRPRYRGRFDGIIQGTPGKSPGILEVFVSPFTSKYDPSESYWSHLVARVCNADPSRPLRLHVDVGKNASTLAFTQRLLRSVRGRVGAHVQIVDASLVGGQLSLGGVLEALRATHLVLCTDSFLAHAAPLFRCLTFVVARSGVENWRVPYVGNFYFDGHASGEVVGSQMAQLLLDVEISASSERCRAEFTHAEADALDQLAKLEETFDEASAETASRTVRAFQKFQGVAAAIGSASSRTWGERRWLVEETRVLSAGGARSMVRHTSELAADRPLVASPVGQVHHYRDAFEQCRNANHFKYLRLRLEPSDVAPGRRPD